MRWVVEPALQQLAAERAAAELMRKEELREPERVDEVAEAERRAAQDAMVGHVAPPSTASGGAGEESVASKAARARARLAATVTGARTKQEEAKKATAAEDPLREPFAPWVLDADELLLNAAALSSPNLETAKEWNAICRLRVATEKILDGMKRAQLMAAVLIRGRKGDKAAMVWAASLRAQLTDNDLAEGNGAPSTAYRPLKSILREGTEDGCAHSPFFLGDLHLDVAARVAGDTADVPHGAREGLGAITAYTKAAKAGVVMAMHNVAFVLEHNDRTKGNEMYLDRARKWYAAAADAGFGPALQAQGRFAFEERRPEEARALWERAAAQGSSTAKVDLARITWQESDAMRAPAAAMLWEAAVAPETGGPRIGDDIAPDGLLLLGRLYLDRVLFDPAKARHIFGRYIALYGGYPRRHAKFRPEAIDLARRSLRMEHQCWRCRKQGNLKALAVLMTEAEVAGAMQRCGTRVEYGACRRCKRARYCSRACRDADVERHRAQCEPDWMTNELAAAHQRRMAQAVALCDKASRKFERLSGEVAAWRPVWAARRERDRKEREAREKEALLAGLRKRRLEEKKPRYMSRRVGKAELDWLMDVANSKE